MAPTDWPSALVEPLVPWLTTTLRADEFARLEEAGHTSARRVPLGEVFVDVPVNPETAPPAAEALESVDLPPGALARLLAVKPETGFFEEEAGDRTATTAQGAPQRLRGRHVLVGGAGQGKSTLVQMLAQLHRQELLAPFRDALDVRSTAVLDGLRSYEGPRPNTSLLPLVLTLRRFASWVVAHRADASDLLTFLLEEAHERFKITLDGAALHNALMGGPWLLVLDGLDEVPDAGDRTQCLRAVDAFLDAHRTARCQVVATTRPQGYGGEFRMDQITLRDFSPKRALVYAKRLIARRHPDDHDRQRQIHARLRHAAENPATARLLGTPLQVTFMTALLTESARVPMERWRLFRDYYALVVRRESDRDDDIATIASRDRTHLDAIHERVGLLLHAESERAGGSAASMEYPRFIEVVEQRLIEERFSRERAAERARELASVVERRLVFLTEVQAGKVGFEIRSFQEFMAAEALFNGREQAVLDRVRVIAVAPAWRNVLVFIASRAMATGSSLREAFTIELCRWLDGAGSPRSVSRSRGGARLALDLLDEGSVTSSPALWHDVTEHALTLLDLPSSETHARLADVLVRTCQEPDSEAVVALVQESLRQRLQNGKAAKEVGAWAVAILLADGGLTSVREILDAAWPEDMQAQEDVLRAFTWTSRESKWVLPKLPAAIAAFGADVEGVHLRTQGLTEFKWLYDWSWAWSRATHNVALAPAVDVRFVALGAHIYEVPETARLHRYWRWIHLAHQFNARPDRGALASSLEHLADDYDAELVDRMLDENRLPWVLTCALLYASDAEGLRVLAGLARAGELGDVMTWRAAESRWRKAGVSHDDLMEFARRGGLPGPTIDRVGAPTGQLRLRSNVAPPQSLVGSVCEAWRAATTARARALLGDWLVDLARALHERQLRVDPSFTLPELRALCLRRAASNDGSVGLEAIDALVGEAPEEARLEVFEWLTTSESMSMQPDILRPQESATLLEGAIARGRSRVLLRVLGFLPIAHHPMRPVSPDLLVDRDDDPPDIRASVALLVVHRGGLSTDQGRLLGQQLVASASEHLVEPWSLALEVLHHRERSLSEGDLALIEAIIDLGPREAWWTTRRAVEVLVAHARGLESGLSSRERWEGLQLPLTPLAPTGADDSQLPIVFERVEIANLGCFEKVTLEGLHVEPDRGQWIVALGENGSGKTTFLRAIAMATAGREVGEFALGSREPGYRTNADQPGKVTVTLRDRPVYQAVIQTGEARESFAGSGHAPPFLVAYGCARGSATANRENIADFSTLASTRTLFEDARSGLIHGERWLRDLEDAARKEEQPGRVPNGATAIRNAVNVALGTLLPKVRITTDDDGVWAAGELTGGVRVPLAVLSEGYLTTLGWALDLMARWLHPKRKAQAPIPEGFPAKMTGVVLIDEIDLHLHPRWQVRVVRDLRRVFRRMTFVVTTHNPMTLVGARADEIWVLERNERGRVVARRPGVDPRLRTGSDLYARFFGLDDVYPDELGRALRRYGFLAANPYRTDDEEREMEEHRALLASEDVEPGVTPLPREAL